MGMPAQEAITTIEELLALPEDGMRHELLDGEHVVTPSPRFIHQLILGEVWELLAERRQPPSSAVSNSFQLRFSRAGRNIGASFTT
jgi:hypothetical protein